MLVRPYDTNGDFTPVVCKSDLSSGSQAVSQIIISRLRFFQGEWWEDMDDGLPVLNALVNGDKQMQTQRIIENIVTKYIATCPCVKEVTAVKSKLLGRRMVIGFSFVTEDGIHVERSVTEDELLPTLY